MVESVSLRCFSAAIFWLLSEEARTPSFLWIKCFSGTIISSSVLENSASNPTWKQSDSERISNFFFFLTSVEWLSCSKIGYTFITLRILSLLTQSIQYTIQRAFARWVLIQIVQFSHVLIKRKRVIYKSFIMKRTKAWRSKLTKMQFRRSHWTSKALCLLQQVIRGPWSEYLGQKIARHYKKSGAEQTKQRSTQFPLIKHLLGLQFPLIKAQFIFLQ